MHALLPRTLLHTAQQAFVEIVDPLPPVIEPAARMLPGEVLDRLFQFVLLIPEPLAGKLAHAFAGLGNELAARNHSGSDDLGSGAGRGRAQIGDEVTDGKIDFVADSGNDWKLRFVNGAGDDFFIESPQILETAATARHKDEFESRAFTRWPVSELIEQANRGGDFSARAIALNAAGNQNDQSVR